MGSGERLIFVAGAPRSGTTLVQNILDTHSEIFGGPEFDRIPNIVDCRRKLQNSIALGRIEVFCTPSDVDRAIANLIEDLLLPVAARNNKKFVSEKTPWNILAFVDLLEIFPKARFIHVIRDPRAVVSSMLQVGARARKKGVRSADFTRKVGLAINYIETCYEVAQKAHALAPDRILDVVFEHLVESTEAETRRICAFLEVPWEEHLLTPSQKSHAGENNLLDFWYTPEMYNRDPDVSERDKWRKKLHPVLAVLVALTFADNPHVLKYGYDFSINEYGLKDRMMGSLYYRYFRYRYGYNNAPLRVLA